MQTAWRQWSSLGKRAESEVEYATPQRGQTNPSVCVPKGSWNTVDGAVLANDTDVSEFWSIVLSESFEAALESRSNGCRVGSHCRTRAAARRAASISSSPASNAWSSKTSLARIPPCPGRALTASLGSLDRLCVCDSMVGSGTAHFRASSTQVWGMLHHCGPLEPKFGILENPWHSRRYCT